MMKFHSLFIKPFTHQLGFSLLEIVIVLAIIAVLATLATPDMSSTVAAKQVKETVALFDKKTAKGASYKELIEHSYFVKQGFPSTNAEALMPDSQKIVGNFMSGADVVDGAIHISFGQKAHPKLNGKTLSLRPLYVEGSFDVPISWVCGYDTVPEGLTAAGANQTDIDMKNLPILCR